MTSSSGRRMACVSSWPMVAQPHSLDMRAAFPHRAIPRGEDDIILRGDLPARREIVTGNAIEETDALRCRHAVGDDPEAVREHAKLVLLDTVGGERPSTRRVGRRRTRARGPCSMDWRVGRSNCARRQR